MTLTIELKLNGKLIGGAVIRSTGRLATASDYEVEAVETAAPGHTGHGKDFRSVFTVKGFPREQTVWALVARVAALARYKRKSGEYDQEPRSGDPE